MSSAQNTTMVAPGPENPPASAGIDWQGVVRISERCVGTVVAVILVALMLITAVDVVGRYFLASPLPGALELTEMLLAALLSTSLPSVILRGENVTIDLFDKVFQHPVVSLLQRCFAGGIVTVCCGFLTWHLWSLAQQVRAAAETTATLSLPVYPAAYLITAMVAVATVAGGLMAIGFVRQLD